MSAPIDRRRFLAGGAALAVLGLSRPLAGQSQLPGAGATGSLGDPAAAGRPQTPTSTGDNDLAIQALEKRLRCTCGCTLDVYTCRTTDFSCTYSPQLHREVMQLWNSGMNAQQVIDTFVTRYGEQALMAPKPQGFNLAGYLLPGTLVAGAGAVMLWILTRRRAIAGVPVAVPGVPADATAEELERLRQALAESDQ